MARRPTGALPPRVALGFALVLAVASFPLPAVAARWDTYNNANRLNSVTATRGVVWTASDLGVHRFDPLTGQFTRLAKTATGLVTNAVTEVEVDAAGNTWFATRGRGVSVLTPSGSWRTLTRFDGLPADTALCLEPSPIGMWVGTSAGAALFDGFELVATWPDGVNPSPFIDNEILDLAHVGDSTWVGTPGGPYVTRTDEGVTWLSRPAGLANPRVRSLTARGTEVWCVAGGDVYRGGETGAWTLAEEGLPLTTATTIRARGDSLLLGTGAGVFLRTVADPTWQLLGVGFPTLAWVDFGDDGSLWAGNVESLWRWDGTAWRRHDSPGPRDSWVHGMALDGSRLWIATRFGGVSRFDGTSWRTYFPQPGAVTDTTLHSPDFMFSMFVDSRGDKWIGDWGGSIARLDDSGAVPAFTHYWSFVEGSFDKFNTFGWSSAEDPSGNVWIGLDTDNAGQPPPPYGMHRISPGGQRATFNPQNGAAMSSSERVRAIAFAPGAGFEMWVGYANSGVDVFTDPTLSTRAAHFSDVDTAPENAVNNLIHVDVWSIQFNGDSVWVGTSGGLSRFSRADRLRKESIGTQPPSGNGAVSPLSIAADGSVWWATKAGLLHRKTDRSVEVFNAANSPLLSDDVTGVVVDRSTGDVWIGTVIGVNRYSPTASSTGSSPGVATFTTYPNPAHLSAAGVRLFGVGVTGTFTGRVIDVRGRVIRTLRGNATNGPLWDATDEEGRRVGPGLYLLSVTQGGTTRTGRVLLVR